MKQYFVTWTIDIMADSAKEAAEKALEIQRDPDSTAIVFMVQERSLSSVFGESETIDLHKQ